MSRVRNADEFRLLFRRICSDYERKFGPRIDKIRRLYAAETTSSVNESLEAHVRAYKVNALLASLNWRLDLPAYAGLPNLVPEVPVESQESGRVRFLDYLGLERDTDRPLLLVETKRRKDDLPHLTAASADRYAATRSEVIARGVTGEALSGEWSAWFKTLKDYVRSIHASTNVFPMRVVITNGEWIIIFLDVEDAFAAEGACDPGRILVFIDRNDVERRSAELFSVLEYGIVSREAGGFTLSELPFVISGADVERLMHGLRLRYHVEVTIYQLLPVISVAPVIFLRSRYGGWIWTEASSTDYKMPYEGSRLSEHLAEVDAAAIQMRQRVNDSLKIALVPSPLSKHYEDEDSFCALCGVTELHPDSFVIVTGDMAHYLRREPSVPQCPYHDWAVSNVERVATNPVPIFRRSVEPRSFFVSGETHHCAHRDVDAAKASKITVANRNRCGLRSGKEGAAFCEIWRFETFLCCRTCAFEEVCTKAEVFHLPCQRLS